MSSLDWFGVWWSQDDDSTDDDVVIDTEALSETDVPVESTGENDLLVEALRGVIDPEVGINIVDLGLVYSVEQRGEQGADVVLTMTTPACPLSAVIEEDVRSALSGVGVEQVNVAVVFEPRWDPRMMSDSARFRLGS